MAKQRAIYQHAGSAEVFCENNFTPLARDQKYLKEGEFEEVHDRADKVSRQLHNLIQSLERSNNPDDVREVPQEYVTD